MIRRILLISMFLILVPGLVLGQQPNVPGQVIATADDHVIVAASTGNKILISSIALIATSGTAVNVYLYNGDHDLLGNAANPLTLDKDGGDGPAGIVLPHNPVGWFSTDTVSESIQLNMSASVPVIVIVNYTLAPNF